MDIYPSVLTDSASKLTQYVEEKSQFFSHFQIDIADGLFVKHKTVSIEEVAEKLVAKKLNKQPMQISPETTFELHLMVENFEKEMPHIDEIATHLPITTILIHFQPAVRWTQGDHTPLHEKLHAHFPYTFGLSLNPEVDIDSHYETLQHFETIQIMTISPGSQGQPIIPKTLNKIDQLRSHGYEGRIILDGAMNATTLPKILERDNWPDAICPGSYFSSNTEKSLIKLQDIVLRAQEKRF